MSLLNFEQPLDLPVLEAVVMTLHTGRSPALVQVCNSILSQFKEHPQAWTRCHTILEQAQSDMTKFFALQVRLCRLFAPQATLSSTRDHLRAMAPRTEALPFLPPAYISKDLFF